MKRSKRLYVLLGVLAAACALTFAVMRMEEAKEQIKSSGEIVLSLSGEDVQALSWEYEDTALAFHKDERWLYDADEAFPVDGEKIDELLAPFASFGVSFVIEEVGDYGLYGLDEPVCTIQITTAAQTYEIALGDFSSMDAERYVSIGDGNVYLAKSDPLEQYDAVLRDLIDHDEPLDYGQVSQITFSGSESYGIFYAEDSADSYRAEDVYFTEQNGETLPLDTARVEDYLATLSLLDLSDYVTYNATEAELEAYGLDDPELTVAVDYTDTDGDGKEVSGAFVLSVSRDPGELAAAEEAAETAEADEAAEEEELTAYARVGGSQIVYQISGSEYEALMAAAYDDLRHRELLPADFADVVRVDISLDGAAYTFAAEGEGEERIWYYQEEELDLEDFQTALEGLRASSADSFTSEAPDGKEEIGLTIHLDREDAPAIQIALYRYDGSDCLAVVDGRTVARIPRADAVALIEAVHAIVLA